MISAVSRSRSEFLSVILYKEYDNFVSVRLGNLYYLYYHICGISRLKKKLRELEEILEVGLICHNGLYIHKICVIM